MPFLIGMMHFADAGLYEHALRCADAAEDLDQRDSPVYQDAVQTAREKLRALAQGGSAGAAESRTGHSALPAETGLTLWWPQREYVRLERQLPELTAIIGSPWRRHVTSVEASLRNQALRGHREQRLLPAEFDGFIAYLTAADVDLRTTAALDRFAAPGRETGDWLVPRWVPDATDTMAWPPRPKDRCWCGSGDRYKNCCGAPAT